MVRIIFMYVLPVLLPTIAYVLWVWFRARWVKGHGGEPPVIERGRIPYLLALGAVLTVAGLGTWAMIYGKDPESVYTPAQFIDGKIVPGTHAQPAADATDP